MASLGADATPDEDPTPMAINGADLPPVDLDDDGGVEALVASAYEAHHAEVFAFLARATRDPALAEDLLGETFRRLTNETRSERAPDRVRGVLYRIGSTVVIERGRQGTAAPGRPGRGRRREPGRISASSAGDRDLALERSTDIERALDGLSLDARVALLLSSEGFHGEEIAAAIGRTPSATRTLLGVARARVRVRRSLFAAEGR